MDDRDIILALFGVVSVLIGAVAFLVWKAFERNEERTELRELRDEGRDRDLGHRHERFGDRQMSQGESLAALRADINALKMAGEKCDSIDRDVAVLKDFKERAEAKFDEVDETSRELRGMSEQMKTAFNQMKDLPEQITARVKAEIPKVVLDTLSAAKALNQSGRAA